MRMVGNGVILGFCLRSVVALLLGIAAAVWSAAPAFADWITRRKKDGSVEKVEGEIIKDDIAEGVVFRPKGVARGQVQIPPEEIVSVEYEVLDDQYQNAMTAYRAGRYERAAEDLKSLYDELQKFHPPPVRPYIAYYYGDSLGRSGKEEEAVAVFQLLLRKFPKTRLAPEAVVNLVQLKLNAKKYAEARALLSQLSGLGERYAAMALYWEGMILEEQGEGTLGAALDKYTEVSQRHQKDLAAQAQLAIARIHVKQDELTKAREFAEKALSASGQEALVVAGAYGIIGDVHFAEALKIKEDREKIQDRLQEALLAYVRVVVRYPKESAAAYACYRAGKTCLRLAEFPKFRQLDYKKRAKRFFQTCVERHPGTAWERHAQEELQNLR